MAGGVEIFGVYGVRVHDAGHGVQAFEGSLAAPLERMLEHGADYLAWAHFQRAARLTRHHTVLAVPDTAAAVELVCAHLLDSGLHDQFLGALIRAARAHDQLGDLSAAAADAAVDLTARYPGPPLASAGRKSGWLGPVWNVCSEQ